MREPAQRFQARQSDDIHQALGRVANASPIIASLKDQRESESSYSLALPGRTTFSTYPTNDLPFSEKVENLQSFRKEVALLNGLITPSPATLAGSQSPTPDIGAMLDGLIVFSGLWAGVRSFVHLPSPLVLWAWLVEDVADLS